MKKRTWFVLGVAGITVVTGIVVLALQFPLPKQGQARVEAEAGLPLTLTPELHGDAVGIGELYLEPDGKAVLEGIPVGEVDAARRCTVWDGVTTFTGKGVWSANRALDITIATERGSIIVGPYNPRIGDIAWYRFAMPLCDEEQVWYSAKSAAQ
ncbi:MAG: hypothetical protein CVT61_12405 [Actinobacteria bacterium HGW-Actinobacteria-11]|nr:MAG: hypothetical protein CVT61_12405 [Actinobacteria bacterium HGW-Actinobacteria-11]